MGDRAESRHCSIGASEQEAPESHRAVFVSETRDDEPIPDEVQVPPEASVGKEVSEKELRASSGFIRASKQQAELQLEGLSDFQRALKVAINSQIFNLAVGFTVCATLVLIIMDTDTRACDAVKLDCQDDLVVPRLLHLSFVLFAVEVGMRMYVERVAFFFKTRSNRIDVFVLSVGLLEYILVFFGRKAAILNVLRVIRLCRLLRMLRLFRLISFLKELKRLLLMMGSCFRTLFWSMILLILVMTVWAIIMVELINPLVQTLAKEGQWEDCARCARSYSSVYLANLTLFSTVVGGDSWGQISLPIMERWPSTAIIFAASLMTLVFGVLNLIVAVVVDTFAKDASRDIDGIVAEMEVVEAEEKEELAEIFRAIDDDGNGDLSLEELLEGASKVPRFCRWLRFLDIDAQDLTVLFEMVDADGSGGIDPGEFIEALYRFKNNEPRTATYFIKYLVGELIAKHQSSKPSIEPKCSEQCDLLNAIAVKQQEILTEFDGKRRNLLAESQNLLLDTLDTFQGRVDSQLEGLSQLVVNCQTDRVDRLGAPHKTIPWVTPEFGSLCKSMGGLTAPEADAMGEDHLAAHTGRISADCIPADVAALKYVEQASLAPSERVARRPAAALGDLPASIGSVSRSIFHDR